jgi:hypothetical protein
MKGIWAIHGGNGRDVAFGGQKLASATIGKNHQYSVLANLLDQLFLHFKVELNAIWVSMLTINIRVCG